MVIYPIFIRLFYFTHQSVFLNTEVSFHFHLHNYYMYKLVSLLTFYSSGIDITNGFMVSFVFWDHSPFLGTESSFYRRSKINKLREGSSRLDEDVSTLLYDLTRITL